MQTGTVTELVLNSYIWKTVGSRFANSLQTTAVR